MKNAPILLLLIILTTGCIAPDTEENLLGSVEVEKEASKLIVANQSRGGVIEKDEIWNGEILVNEEVIIPQGITLTVEPGTVVKFKHSRDYKHMNKLGFDVRGVLRAVGTPKKQIWFTSDATDPINGDWGMLRFVDAGNKSEMKYVIVEFAQQGINIWNSSPVISHSIVRWSNWEGIYLESFSKPIIEYNRIYQNGYNGIAMEQFNDAVVRYNHIFKSGTNGVHIDVSKALVENNIVEENANGLSVDDAGTLLAFNNTLRNNRGSGIDCGEGDNKLTATGNYFENNGAEEVNCPAKCIIKNVNGSGAKEFVFDYPDTKKFNLGYTPGDPEKDRYMYVYPDDESRRIVKKIGEGLGLTWSVAWDGEYIWAAALWGDVYKFDPENGTIVRHFTVSLPQAWGMTFDGKNLWITDFAEKKTYEIDPENGTILSVFSNPDQTGGAKGIAWDSEYLYLMGWTSPTIYKVDKKGNLIERIELKGGGGGGLAFDGMYFWVPGCAGICKYDKKGKVVGEIYAASEGTWDLAWDDKHKWLWATQRTNENWQDAKIFALEVLDDSLK